MNSFKRLAGFTLIELMVAAAVIAILAAIAYPSYQESIRKGRRTDAKEALLSLQLDQEKFRASCPQYATTIGNAYSCAPGDYTLVGSATSVRGYYGISVVVAGNITYNLKATRLTAGLQDGDECGDFQINQNGDKSVVNSTSGYSVATCW